MLSSFRLPFVPVSDVVGSCESGIWNDMSDESGFWPELMLRTPLTVDGPDFFVSCPYIHQPHCQLELESTGRLVLHRSHCDLVIDLGIVLFAEEAVLHLISDAVPPITFLV